MTYPQPENEKEQGLADRGLCWWMTAYGMPWIEYCEEPTRPNEPYCPEHMTELNAGPASQS
jgi:hypothetical protein